MALTVDEQELVDAVNAAMPGWFKGDARAQEDLGMMAKMFGKVRDLGDHWLRNQTRVKLAAAATVDEPDWLNQHARDRGTWRQGAELTSTLRYRLRALSSAAEPASVTRGAILAMIATTLANEAVAGTAYLYEYPRDAAFLTDEVTQDTGIGGTFVGPSSGEMVFTPTGGFAYRPVAQAEGRVISTRLEISGAANAGNNGTFTILGLSVNGVRYANGSGVAATDATVAWGTLRMLTASQAMEGHSHSYAYDPGDVSNAALADRAGPGGLAGIIAILPLGTSQALADAIAEQIRRIKAAGVVHSVERRLV